jgi:PhnB protein
MQVNPYLFFNGDCEAAFRFYAKVLGGEIGAMLPHAGTPAEEHVPKEWRDKVMHAQMTFDGEVLMGADAPPAHYNKPQGMAVTLHFDDPAEAEKKFNALLEGGDVQMPIGKTFFARAFGIGTDRFGIPWMFNCT